MTEEQLLDRLQEVFSECDLPLWKQIAVLSQIFVSFAEMQSGKGVKNVLLVPQMRALLINVPLDSEIEKKISRVDEPS